MHIHTNDIVQIITGEDRGVRGKVLRVIPKRRKVVVEGVNRVYKHMKRNQKQVLPELMKKFGRKNQLSLPRLEKIVVNMGVGSAVAEKKNLEDAVAALTQITGQKPLVTKARKAIAGFKLREGLQIGCKV